MARSYEQICPIARTLDVVGDRWTLLIVRDLFFGNARFGELLEVNEGLPPRLLSDRLKRLEERGLVTRTVYRQHPLRAEYHLTEKGRSLAPVLEAIVAWGLEHTLEPKLRTKVAGYIERRLTEAGLRYPAGSP